MASKTTQSAQEGAPDLERGRFRKWLKIAKQILKIKHPKYQSTRGRYKYTVTTWAKTPPLNKLWRRQNTIPTASAPRSGRTTDRDPNRDRLSILRKPSLIENMRMKQHRKTWPKRSSSILRPRSSKSCLTQVGNIKPRGPYSTCPSGRTPSWPRISWSYRTIFRASAHFLGRSLPPSKCLILTVWRRKMLVFGKCRGLTNHQKTKKISLKTTWAARTAKTSSRFPKQAIWNWR